LPAQLAERIRNGRQVEALANAFDIGGVDWSQAITAAGSPGADVVEEG